MDDDKFNKDCYFFHFSEFKSEKNKYLDGVIISANKRVRLCLNCTSEKYESFKTSKLAAYFLENNGLNDPNNILDSIVVFDGAGLSDDNEKINHLRDKLKRPKLLNMDLESYTLFSYKKLDL
ncbi:MAG: hypothetical protein HRT90_04855 [Candidatus Margulisbacteria bacterium]|nr:hypothetical protein [Candidatus Margulisiibacteriota bacterium]